MQVADRMVEDRFVDLTPDNQASAKEKNAVGFVMTIYRRRLASSFAPLRETLEDRLNSMEGATAGSSERVEEDAEIDPIEVGADQPGRE